MGIFKNVLFALISSLTPYMGNVLYLTPLSYTPVSLMKKYHVCLSMSVHSKFGSYDIKNSTKRVYIQLI